MGGIWGELIALRNSRCYCFYIALILLQVGAATPMAQLEGRTLCAWLTSADAEPSVLLGFEAESLIEEEGGNIIQAAGAGLLIEMENRQRQVPARMLKNWVVQGVPAALVRRIEAHVAGLPPAVLQELSAAGFDSSALSRAQAEAAFAVLEALAADQEANFNDIGAVSMLLGAASQGRAARCLLEQVMQQPFIKAAGSARIQLAQDASSKGDIGRMRALTDPALPSNRAEAGLTETTRGILLTIRAAGLGQVASGCRDLDEARAAADAAFAIQGNSKELARTYLMLRNRSEALRCTWQ